MDGLFWLLLVLDVFSCKIHTMSSHDQALASLVSQLALSFDGAVLGVALAYAAVRTLLKFKLTSAALSRIRKVETLRVSDLRSVLPPEETSSETPSDEPVVIVRGVVKSKSTVDGGNWKSLRPQVLVSQESGDKAVVIQRTQSCVYNQWRGVFGWTSDIRSIFGRSLKKTETSSLRTVPFVLVDSNLWPQSDYVVVNLEGSGHPLPLTTVYHQLRPINASAYTFLQALFGHEYPVGLLDQEKILPLGKEITVVGVCRFSNGAAEIKSCKDLPYFLSDMSKDEMLLQLAFRSKILLWSGVILGSLSIGVLGYAFIRNWNRWKSWSQQRRLQETSHSATDDNPELLPEEEEVGDVPDGTLCVICLMRRRRSAFIPCGHLVCCQRCAISVERETAATCPVCRQGIRSSVRIYES